MPGRVCILLMDSLGIGASLDAHRYGDEGANTFAHIYEACSEGRASHEGVRQGALMIPNLASLGLYHASIASSGKRLLDLATLAEPLGYYGYAVEQSLGKDTPSGHWELAGVPDIVLPRLLTEMLHDPVFDVRMYATFLVYATPYRRPVAEVLLQEMRGNR